jgi:hypothetical protein
MEYFRAAERALVTALVLGDADPLEFSGRLSAADFTDPAAAVIFRAVMDARPARSARVDQPTGSPPPSTHRGRARVTATSSTTVSERSPNANRSAGGRPPHD